MSGIGKAVKKVFKAVAPIAIGVGLSYIAGPIGTAVSSALGGGVAGGLGGKLAGGLVSGAMQGFGGGPQTEQEAYGMSSSATAQPITSSSSSTFESEDSSGGGIMSWIEKNPELAKVIGSGVSGLVSGYAKGKRYDDYMERRREEFNARRDRAGAFYGRPGVISGAI